MITAAAPSAATATVKDGPARRDLNAEFFRASPRLWCDSAATTTQAWSARAAKYRSISSTLDQPPPELLQAFYTQLLRRHGAPGVRLLDFPGRWLVFRTADLAAGVERAVIDIDLSEHDTTRNLAEMQSRANLAVGKGDDATLVLMYLARRVRPGHAPHAAPPRTVLSITMWSLHTPRL
jgi:hypothetical protein